MAIFSATDLLKETNTKPEDVKSVGIFSETSTSTPTKTFGERAKDVGIGALKGLGSTVDTVASIGRPIMAAIDPNKTTQDFKPQENSVFNEQNLKATNPEQKAGKVLEFAAELLFPVGALTKAATGSKGVKASLEGLGSKISQISDDVVEGGVKVKDKLYQLVGNLDAKTRNALKTTTKEELDNFINIGRKAVEADSNITPYEVVGNKIIDGLKQIQSRASSVGEAKSNIMETAKVGFQKVGNIAQKTALNIQKQFSGIKLDAADSKIVKNFQETLMKLGNNPQLKEVDAAIDLLQDQLYKAGRSNAVEVTDRVTGLLRKSLGELNGQVKTLGGDAYAKLNQEYSDISALIKELNARLGKEGSSAGALVKRLFSPSDARTKELFKELQKLTGQDYFKEGRLAKFVMEALDDPRAKSLLEELPSPTGLIKGAYDYGVRKLEAPFKAAESIIKNR